jgi:hypothetical protein
MMGIGTGLARLEEGFGGKTNVTMVTDPEQKIAG